MAEGKTENSEPMTAAEVRSRESEAAQRAPVPNFNPLPGPQTEFFRGPLRLPSCEHKNRLSEATGMGHTTYEVCADCGHRFV